jgi:hypothetical protein
VTLSNSVNTPLTITGITFNGPNPGVFIQNNDCVSPLPAGASCTINVSFAPGMGGTSNAGPKTANLNVAATNATTQTVTLSGTTTVATVSFAVTGLTGANNGKTTSGTVIVTNVASGSNPGPLTLVAAPTLGPPKTGTGVFAITAGGTCASGTVLTPGSNCTINVQYTAPPSGPVGSSVTLIINDTGATTATQKVVVNGN